MVLINQKTKARQNATQQFNQTDCFYVVTLITLNVENGEKSVDCYQHFNKINTRIIRRGWAKEQSV